MKNKKTNIVETNETNAELTPPLVCYFNRLNSFLKKDPEIKAELDFEGSKITITIHNAVKAAAWKELLPEEMTIGNIKFTIEIISDVHNIVTEDVLNMAFKGNEAFSKLRHVVIPNMGIDRYFCYVNPTILQFANDNFGSPEMLETRTAEDLLREVVDVAPFSICTEPVNETTTAVEEK